MMGPRQVEQDALFDEFSLDTHVPADHLLRFVDLIDLRQELAPFDASTGRPSPISAANAFFNEIDPSRPFTWRLAYLSLARGVRR